METGLPCGYVASPYSWGDKRMNAIFQMSVFEEMRKDGAVIPYIPLWVHFQQEMFPFSYDECTAYLDSIIASLDIKWILRMNAWHGCEYHFVSKSKGADHEVEVVRRLHPDAVVVIQEEDESMYDVMTRLYKELGISRKNIPVGDGWKSPKKV